MSAFFSALLALLKVLPTGIAVVQKIIAWVESVVEQMELKKKEAEFAKAAKKAKDDKDTSDLEDKFTNPT